MKKPRRMRINLPICDEESKDLENIEELKKENSELKQKCENAIMKGKSVNEMKALEN